MEKLLKPSVTSVGSSTSWTLSPSGSSPLMFSPTTVADNVNVLEITAPSVPGMASCETSSFCSTSAGAAAGVGVMFQPSSRPPGAKSVAGISM